jgi:hypothetical protein
MELTGSTRPWTSATCGARPLHSRAGPTRTVGCELLPHHLSKLLESRVAIDVLDQRVVDQGLIVAAIGALDDVLEELDDGIVETNRNLRLPGSALTTAPRFAREKSMSRCFSATALVIKVPLTLVRFPRGDHVEFAGRRTPPRVGSLRCSAQRHEPDGSAGVGAARSRVACGSAEEAFRPRAPNSANADRVPTPPACALLRNGIWPRMDSANSARSTRLDPAPPG